MVTGLAEVDKSSASPAILRVSPLVSVYVLSSKVTSKGLGESQNSWVIPLMTNNLGMLLNAFETEVAITPHGSINLQPKLDYAEITLNKESESSVN